jgi:cysteine desulfurase / selenocysteine lyase
MERDLGIEISIIRGNEFGEIDAEEINKCIKSNTKLIVSTLSSNVNGIIMPVKKIGNIAKENNIPFLLDASQGAGSIKIDVEELNLNLLAFPGHKGLMGPQGTGGLYVDEKISLKPIYQGGTGSNSELVYQPEFMPDLHESGTLNTPGIVGLGYGIGFINNFGIENLAFYKHMLIKRLYEGICAIDRIKIYSKNIIESNSGIIAFNFEEVDSTEVSYVLDKVYGVASRAGLHCAPMAHETLGTLKRGIVRLSVSCFNTIDEIDITINAIKEIGDSLKT